jgi:hypothetical protein
MYHSKPGDPHAILYVERIDIERDVYTEIFVKFTVSANVLKRRSVARLA